MVNSSGCHGATEKMMKAMNSRFRKAHASSYAQTFASHFREVLSCSELLHGTLNSVNHGIHSSLIPDNLQTLVI